MAGNYRNPVVGGLMSLLGSKNTTASPVQKKEAPKAESKASMSGGMLGNAKRVISGRQKQIDDAVKKAGG